MAQLISTITNQSEAWTQLQRLREAGHVPHALAFCGSSASPVSADFVWAFAQSLVCERDQAPCGGCGPCLRLEKHQSESVLHIEAEKGTIKLEATERIAQFLALQRMTKVRVILVQDAQGLNPQATNAILKLVEEPPPQTYFLFITPEAGQLLPTLRSRVQVIRLKAPLREPAEDPDNLRAHVMDFLSSCLKRNGQAVRNLFETVSDRGASELAAQTMQHILRDWSLLGTGEELHRDLTSQMNSWPAWEPHARVELWRMAQQMETDLHSNVDRNLVFENFYQRVPRAMD